MIKTNKFLSSKLVFISLLIIFLSLLFIQIKQWRERKSIDQEIAELIQQEKSLEQQNQELEQSLKFFASDAYKEQVARQQLGLQKEGEIAVNFPKPGELIIGTESQEETLISNPQKWWTYLFLNDNTND